MNSGCRVCVSHGVRTHVLLGKQIVSLTAPGDVPASTVPYGLAPSHRAPSACVPCQLQPGLTCALSAASRSSSRLRRRSS
jgi:hypothetical protein